MTLGVIQRERGEQEAQTNKRMKLHREVLTSNLKEVGKLNLIRTIHNNKVKGNETRR